MQKKRSWLGAIEAGGAVAAFRKYINGGITQVTVRQIEFLIAAIYTKTKQLNIV